MVTISFQIYSTQSPSVSLLRQSALVIEYWTGFNCTGAVGYLLYEFSGILLCTFPIFRQDSPVFWRFAIELNFQTACTRFQTVAPVFRQAQQFSDSCTNVHTVAPIFRHSHQFSDSCASCKTVARIFRHSH